MDMVHANTDKLPVSRKLHPVDSPLLTYILMRLQLVVVIHTLQQFYQQKK